MNSINVEKVMNKNDVEDKQVILDLLLPTLQATRNLEDLTGLKYIAEIECVEATFNNCKKFANVAGDSGTSMIKDVINQII